MATSAYQARAESEAGENGVARIASRFAEAWRVCRRGPLSCRVMLEIAKLGWWPEAAKNAFWALASNGWRCVAAYSRQQHLRCRPPAWNLKAWLMRNNGISMASKVNMLRMANILARYRTGPTAHVFSGIGRVLMLSRALIKRVARFAVASVLSACANLPVVSRWLAGGSILSRLQLDLRRCSWAAGIMM